MGKLFTILSAVTAALSVQGAAVQPQSARSSPPGSPSIASVVFSGNGCPQGSDNPASVDSTSLNFQLTKFQGSLYGSGDSIACQAHISLVGGGPGWQLSLETVSVTGQLTAKPDTEVAFYTTAFWSQDAGNTINKEWRISNPGSWTSKQVSIRSTLGSVSPCGSLGILNVNFRAALSDGTSASFGAIDRNTPVTEKLQFAWRAC